MRRLALLALLLIAFACDRETEPPVPISPPPEPAAAAETPAAQEPAAAPSPAPAGAADRPNFQSKAATRFEIPSCTIRGTISGELCARRIRAVLVGTETAHETVAQQDGSYSLVVPAGTYRVRVSPGKMDVYGTVSLEVECLEGEALADFNVTSCQEG
jgi:hypothetical protein